MSIIKLNKQSLAEQLFLNIKQMILSGELKKGDAIPEEKIAEDFEVSRTPVREALRRLEHYGLVALRPFAKVIAFTAEEMRQVAIVRASLECLAVRLLIERKTRDDMADLAALSKECRALFLKNDLAGAFEKDSLFHFGLAKRTGNLFLVQLFENLDAKVQLLRITKQSSKENILKNIDLHIPLLEAIIRKDQKKAEELMHAHVMADID